MPNLIIGIPDGKTARPERMAIARHPRNHRLYRGMEYPVRHLVVIFTKRYHMKAIAA